jgi:hypothetical protein
MNNFREWLDELNDLVESELVLGIDDLPDMPYRDWFEEGLSADEVFDLMLDELEMDGNPV